MKSTLLAFLFVIPFVSSAQTERANVVKIFPNPTSDQITIEGYSEGFERLVIYDSSGKSVRDEISVVENNADKIVLDLSSLNRGVYYFKANARIEKIFKE